MSRRAPLAASLLALALIAACGGEGATETDRQPSGDPVTDTTEGAGTDATSPTPSEPSGDEAETLAAFMGWGGENSEQNSRDQEARVQEAIRVCMAEQGFEYIPVVPPDGAFRVFEEGDEEERIRQQGFGITTWFGNEDQFDTGVEWDDPNNESLEAMSDSERQAWDTALYGTEEEQQEGTVETVDEETGEVIIEGSGFGAGCSGQAYEAEYGGAGVNELWDQLSPAFEAMYERVQADPRVVEANEEWAACMATAGYDGLTSREDIWETVFEDFNQRFEAIVGENGGYADPMEGWTEEEMEAFFEEKTDEEINAFFEQAQRDAQADVDQEAVVALQQEEIDMAVADFECGEGLNDLMTEVSEEYEADFIAENRAVLEQIRDAQGG